MVESSRIIVCQDCGRERRHQARQKCAACYHKWLMATNPQAHANQLKNNLDWMRENKAHLSDYRSDYAKRRAAKRYGITRERLDELLSRGCEVCGRKDRLCIDHDHTTGVVRGCLCVNCNAGVGWIENTEWFRRACDYLRRAGEHQECRLADVVSDGLF